MTRKLAQWTLAITLIMTAPTVYGQGRGKEPEKPGGRAGGSKPEHKPETKPGEKPGAKPGEKPGKEQPPHASAGKTETKPGAKNPGGDWSERTHSGKQSNQPNTAAGEHGAAAGRAAENNKTPQVSGAKGAAAGAAVEKSKSPQVSGTEGAVAGATAAHRNSANDYAAVRSSFHQPDMYGEHWYGDHPGAWTAAGVTGAAAWTASSWNSVASHCGYGTVTPIPYHYGENVTNQNGLVLVNSAEVGTTAQYSQQAAALAKNGIQAETPSTDRWIPLGVFALVRNETQHPQVIVQLAINQSGVLRGNYTDEVVGNTLPIQGSVDQKTQRAAWTVNGNLQSVMEAGLHNLTESEAPVLIHRQGQTDHWILVRLEQNPQN